MGEEGQLGLPSDLPGGTADRIMAVIVTATDENEQQRQQRRLEGGAAPPLARTPTTALDFKKLHAGNFLVEVDSTDRSQADIHGASVYRPR